MKFGNPTHSSLFLISHRLWPASINRMERVQEKMPPLCSPTHGEKLRRLYMLNTVSAIQEPYRYVDTIIKVSLAAFSHIGKWSQQSGSLIRNTKCSLSLVGITAS
ncbi:MAG TPA: hypothetical protein DHE23_01685 [Agrobacterium sp.]|nr:hypothetical protein [Agrobacterium sp.]